MSRKSRKGTVRLLSAYLFIFASALSVGAVIAGPPTPLVPAESREQAPRSESDSGSRTSTLPALPTVDVPPAAEPGFSVEPPPPSGHVYVPESSETAPAQPAERAEANGFGERAGRAVDETVEATGTFFGGAADAAEELFDRTTTATGSAFDWMVRETGDLMRRSGETLQRWAE